MARGVVADAAEVRPVGPRPLDEQRRGLVGRQRIDRVQLLAVDAERLPAGGQHGDVRAVPDHGRAGRPPRRARARSCPAPAAAAGPAGTRSRSARWSGRVAAAPAAPRPPRRRPDRRRRSGASSHSHAPSAIRSRSRAATSTASRDFPTPPTPVRVTSGALGKGGERSSISPAGRRTRSPAAAGCPAHRGRGRLGSWSRMCVERPSGGGGSTPSSSSSRRRSWW